MTQNKVYNTIEHSLFKWVTPTLIVVIGFLAKNKLDSIEDSMKLIQSLVVTQSNLDIRVTNAEKNIADLQSRIATKSPAKDEKEITLQSLIH